MVKEKKKKGFWIQNLLNRYRLVVISEKTFEERYFFRVSQLNIFLLVLLFVTLALTGVIIWMLWKEKKSHNLIRYGLSFILAGAIGNMIDRLLYGKVVDFLDIMIGDFHWYIFNVADSSVTTGMILFILHTILIGEKKPITSE